MNAASFYKGAVTHRRYGTVEHKLRYRIAYLLLDLDQLESANQASRFLGVDGLGLLSFQSKDHGNGKTKDLAGWIRGYLKDNTVSEKAARIELLTLPRMFGFVFNPISVYFIYNDSSELHHIIYEVNNTFGERHFYLCPASTSNSIIEQVEEKQLYVSPFFNVEGSYHFMVQPPKDQVALTIAYNTPKGTRALLASLTGTHAPVSTWQTSKILLQFPAMTLGVVIGIHWHALRLWIKGSKYRSRKTAHRTKNSMNEAG